MDEVIENIYKIAVGKKDDFEKRVAELEDLGYLIMGEMNTNVINNELVFSLLMWKSEID